MDPVWISLDEGRGYVLDLIGGQLRCWLVENGAAVARWSLPAAPAGQVAAALVGGELWAAVPGPGRIDLVRGGGESWRRQELKLEQGTSPSSLALVPVREEVHVLVQAAEAGGWSLWHWRLSLEGRELAGNLVEAGQGDLPGPGGILVVVVGLDYWLHLFHISLQGAGYRLTYRVAVPPAYQWSPVGLLGNSEEDCGEPAVLLDSLGGVHVLWTEGTGEGTHLVYRYRTPGGWPGGRWEPLREVHRPGGPCRGVSLLERRGETIAAWEAGGTWWYKPLGEDGAEPQPWPGEKPRLMRQGWGGSALIWTNFLPGRGSPPQPVAWPGTPGEGSPNELRSGALPAYPEAAGAELVQAMASLPSLVHITSPRQARELSGELRRWRRVLRETAWQLERLRRRQGRLEARHLWCEGELVALREHEEHLEEFLRAEANRLISISSKI